jgi:hypothetical protein
MDFFESLKAQYPWLESIGLDARWFQEAAATSANTDEFIAKLRGTSQYKSRFPGLYRPDGTMRMTEGQYMQRESDYRTLLRQYGYNMERYRNPGDLAGFFDSEQDPNELQQRLETYRSVKEGGREIKDAFYVYTGMKLSDDDLYSMVVDPEARNRVAKNYNARVMAQQFDYDTWLTRATEVGMQSVADKLTELATDRHGQPARVNRADILRVLQTDTNFAKQVMSAIFTGGQGLQAIDAQPMALQDLLAGFEYAAIGAAANRAGLSMPTKERLAEIRTAGVNRQSAIEGYTAYGTNRRIWDAASRRAGYGGFSQQEFESATFLNDASKVQELQASLAREEAAGREQGGFRFVEREGRLVQSGFTA